jgi:photosystem II stability/assembly factor-like uncharacterized protein
MKMKIVLLACLLSFTPGKNALFAQWQSLGSGIVDSPRTILSISAVSEQTVWATAIHPSSPSSYNYTRTIDGGVTWNSGQISDTIGDYYPGTIFALDHLTAWIIMIELRMQSKVRLFKTTDGANTWIEQTGGFNQSGYAFASIHFFNPNEGIGFGSSGTGDSAIDSLVIFRTADGGNTWVRIPPAILPIPEPDEGQWVYGNNRYAHWGDTLWFGTRTGRVFRTSDKGSTWQAFSTGLFHAGSSDRGISSIAFKNHLEGLATSYSPSCAAKTIDGGATWAPLAIPVLPSAADIAYIPGTNGTYIVHRGLMTTGNQSTFLITHDNGTTWGTKTIAPAMPSTKFLSSTSGFGGGKVLSQISVGIYSWTGDLLSGIDEIYNEASFQITSIIPNPADDLATIYLSGNTNAEVSVKIFNNDERLIMQVSEFATDGKLVLDVANLPAGQYLLKLTSEHFSAAGRLMIQR